MATDEKFPTQEGSGGEDKRLTLENRTGIRTDSCDFFILKEKRSRQIRVNIYITMSFKNFAPCRAVADFIALRSGTPHGRTLGPIEHAELQGIGVRNNAHITAKGIYLPDYLTFSYTSNCRIARHPGKSRKVHA